MKKHKRHDGSFIAGHELLFPDFIMQLVSAVLVKHTLCTLHIKQSGRHKETGEELGNTKKAPNHISAKCFF